MAKKHVYQIGDKVRIITPKFVERVGYPLTCAHVMHEVAEHPKLHEAMRLLGIETSQWRAQQDFIYGVSCALVRIRGFGGKDRAIRYVEGEPHCAGAVTHIDSKRCVRTGTYYAPGGGYDYYEPGGLSNAKSHVLLLTSWGEIEACNVEPV